MWRRQELPKGGERKGDNVKGASKEKERAKLLKEVIKWVYWVVLVYSSPNVNDIWVLPLYGPRK